MKDFNDMSTEAFIVYDEEYLSSVSGAVRSDPAIDIIFMEETQPLLITQKSLDEVIGSIEDRVQTLLDEKD